MDVLIFLILVGLFLAKPSEHLSYFSDYALEKDKILNNSDWMSFVNGSMNITTLAIPGTHDTCTYKFKGRSSIILFLVEKYGRTQSWNLEEQLLAGIRYIDIRLSSDGNIYHGILRTSSTLKSVFETVAIFLKKHNTEGIIMRLSYHQNDRCTKSDCYEKNVIHVLQQYNDILYTNHTIPLLNDIRGKIFLIVGGMTYLDAFQWGGRITLQDFYNLQGDGEKEIIEKKRRVLEYLEKSKNKELFIINHCSASGAFTLVSIKKIAKEVNQVPFNNTEFSGIIPMDFPGEDLITYIINQNFKK